MLEFGPVLMSHRKVVETAVARSRCFSSQLTFPALFALEKYGSMICTEDGVVYIRQLKFDRPGHMAFMVPIADEPHEMQVAFKKTEEYCAHNGVSPIYCDVTDDGRKLLESFYGKKIKYTEMPGAFDYIYLQSALAALGGGKLKKIRQSVNSFKNAYDGRAVFESMMLGDLEEVRKFQTEWLAKYAGQKSEGLDAENRFISKCFAEWQELGLVGGIIRIDGKIRAYTFGCTLNDDTFDVLVEKADFADFPALYRVMNQAFAASLDDKWKYINRENDMGVEGVRTAKQRYRPEILLKKYLAKSI